MASLKAIITDKVQEHLRRADWNAAIAEMERLFALNQDPLIRVRIGDSWRKLARESEAIGEYVLAADLFAEMGFVVKALAQYRLVLRLDPSNGYVRSRMEQLRMNYPIVSFRREPVEYRVPEQPGDCRDLHSRADDHHGTTTDLCIGT